MKANAIRPTSNELKDHLPWRAGSESRARAAGTF
jgi:hypothetical protein